MQSGLRSNDSFKPKVDVMRDQEAGGTCRSRESEKGAQVATFVLSSFGSAIRAKTDRTR
jgi:hypothetical protein